MGTSRQNPTNYGKQSAESPFAPGNRMGHRQGPVPPQFNPQAQTQGNLQGNQRTRAQLEALRGGNRLNGAVPPPTPTGPISNTPGYMPPALQPMNPQTPDTAIAQDPGSIGQPAPIISNTPGYMPPQIQPMYRQPPTLETAQDPGSIGQPAPNNPISTTMPVAPQLQAINQNAGPGGKGGARRAPQYSYLTGLLGGRGG